MASNMNPLFEQDPDYPFFGSSEERMAFYSAKLSRSDEQRSGPAPTAGGPIKPGREGLESVIKIRQLALDDYSFRPIVDIVAAM